MFEDFELSILMDVNEKYGEMIFKKGEIKCSALMKKKKSLNGHRMV